MKEIQKDEKVCYNCKHMAWMVGIGRGLICTNPKKIGEFESIPSQLHSCNSFQFNEKLSNEIQDKKTN